MLAASTMTTLALAPKTVILVRHGAVNREAAGLTPDGLYGGDVDVPLSERGEAEARAAAQFVADTFGSKVTSVFASPMKRAMYGAERTVEALGKSMDVEAREAFREVRRGDWVDKSIEQVSKEYPGEDMQRFLDDYDFNPAGGGESVNEVQARAKKCLLEDVLPSIQEESARSWSRTSSSRGLYYLSRSRDARRGNLRAYCLRVDPRVRWG